MDITPGDRAAICGGMMRPVECAPDGARFVITHKCEQCGKIIRQHTSDDDNMDEIIRLTADASFIFGK